MSKMICSKLRKKWCRDVSLETKITIHHTYGICGVAVLTPKQRREKRKEARMFLVMAGALGLVGDLI